MAFIKELYIVKANEPNKSIERLEFSYEDAFETYVVFCEEGYNATYDKVDERLVKAFNALDEQFNEIVFENIKSKELSKYDDRFSRIYKDTTHALLAVYDSLELFMNATGLYVYSVDNRYQMLKKEYEIRGEA